MADIKSQTASRTFAMVENRSCWQVLTEPRTSGKNASMQKPTTLRAFLERLTEEPKRLVLVGDIVRIDTERRFGFIRSPGRPNTFFSSSHVARNGFRRLKLGQEVEFTVPEVSSGKRIQARSVKPR